MERRYNASHTLLHFLNCNSNSALIILQTWVPVLREVNFPNATQLANGKIRIKIKNPLLYLPNRK